MSCTICNHPERRAIDLALLNRTATLAQLSEQHHLSTSALHRHKQHLLKKVARAQNRFQDLLREGYLLTLNKFLDMVQRAADTAHAEGNSRLLLQAVRQGTNIMKFMVKLDSSLPADTVHRLLASPQWAEPVSLLPADSQFAAGSRQALADDLFAPCPEPSSEPDQALEDDQIIETLAALADLHPELGRNLLAGLSQSLGATASELRPARREKSGKLPGKTALRGGIIKEYQSVNKGEKNCTGPSLSPLPEPGTAGRSGSWIEDLDAGRLSIDFLNAVGAGRLPLDPLPFPG